MKLKLSVLPLALTLAACGSPSSMVKQDSTTPKENLTYLTSNSIVMVCSIDGMPGGRTVLAGNMPCDGGKIWNSSFDNKVNVQLEPGKHDLVVAYRNSYAVGSKIYTAWSKGIKTISYTAEPGKTYKLLHTIGSNKEWGAVLKDVTANK